MSTKTHDDKVQKFAPHHKRDDYEHLESPAHYGLVHDKDDKLTPVDVLFNTKESSAKPKREPREVL